MSAILTGSRAYGTPRPDSDVDLVIRLSPETLVQLIAASDKHAEYPENNSASVRFGILNLICVTSDSAYETWRSNTAALVARKPVTRDEAIESFSLLGIARRFDSRYESIACIPFDEIGEGIAVFTTATEGRR